VFDSTRSYDSRLFDALKEDLQRRVESLRNELAKAEEERHTIESAMEYASVTLERVRQVAARLTLSSEDIGARSQREILRLLAERNGGWLVVSQAIRTMIAAGIYSSDTNASAQVYTLLNPKQSEFVQIVPGVYRLNAEPIEAEPERSSEQSASGLVERVGAILAEHPDWSRKETTAALIRDGWDFDGKSPIFSVSMAYSNLVKREKRKARSRAPRITEAKHTEILVNRLRGVS
jgi:hypothetical protein